MRATVDFGIDLGTTNSSIAVFNGTGADVFKNNEGQEYTPSAVWIDSKRRLTVGRKAKERLEHDGENAYCEFKLQMGTAQIYHFAGSGLQMKPEELSAEVLKSLRGDVQQSTGEEIMAAAISVPAAFELPQCSATNKAAQLAGLPFSPLVQEPVAAALAYGFQSKSDKVFWMVYDFGGGTFDVAIIQVRDGQIQVVNHSGDNHLGGKIIDWEIVERLLVPALTREYTLSDFKRGNPKWKAAFAKLKLHAEEAKIQLSRGTSTDILVDPLCQDDRGMPVKLVHELKRSDIEPLMEPLVERSINKCKETLEQKRLSVGDIEKIILVGGPTLTPIFRDILSKKLNIPLESRMDPLTVNASGAAIFAGTQRMSKDIMQWRPVLAGQYRVELEYKPVGNESDPLVGGKVVPPKGGALAGFTIEFVESKTRWQSGRISLGAKSTFIANVRAEKGRTNEFLIELRDATGNLRETVPDRFPYNIGMEIPNQPLINSIGIALPNNEMQVLLSKGTPLPARHREIHRTTVPLNKGESGTLLSIPVFEGENTKRADRNVRIGELKIPADRIRWDVPSGSEVEITIEIDDTRLVRTKAYVPILDEEFENVLKLGKTVADPKQLADEFRREQARLEAARSKMRETRSRILQAENALRRIQGERMEHDIEVSLAAAQGDPDTADKCEKRLIDFKIAIDEAEDALQWPTLVSEAETEIQNTREIVNKYGKGDDRRNFDCLESEVRAATAAHDADVLRHKTDRMGSLKIGILVQQPGFWVGQFEFLIEQKKSHMRDQVLAERLIAQGRRAIETNDISALQAVVRQLIDLLPAAERQEVPQGAGGTMPI